MFSAFTPLAGGSMDTYYYDNEYPYDLNGALDFVRLPATISPFPFPQTIGHIGGLLPQFDQLVRARLQVGINSTVIANVMNLGVADMSAMFPDLTGGLKKIKG